MDLFANRLNSKQEFLRSNCRFGWDSEPGKSINATPNIRCFGWFMPGSTGHIFLEGK